MPNKKIIMFSYDFPPLEGGISRLCDEIVKKIYENNIDVEILSVKFDVKQGFKDYHFKIIHRVPKKRIFREISSFLFLLKKDKNIPIIVDVWHPEGLIAYFAGFKNIIIFAHGNDVMKGQKTFKNIILNILRKFVLNKAKLILCNSNYTADVVKEQIGNKDNIQVCLLGVDENRFIPVKNKEEKQVIRKKLNLPTDKKIILTVSRINKYKAHDVILKALSLLKQEEREKILYIIAGRGNYEKELKNLIKKFDLEDIVYWYGFVDEEKLPDLYKASDLFVLCTREEKDEKTVEGFGLVFLEAQASGIPVVGVKQGGIPYAVEENEGGILIKRDDYQALSKIFKKLIKNSKKFDEIGNMARKRIEKKATWNHFSQCVFEKIKEKNLL